MKVSILSCVLILGLICAGSTHPTSGWTKVESPTFNNVLEGVAYTALFNVKQWQMNAEDGGSIFGFERELGSIWQNGLTCSTCHVTMDSIDWVASRETLRYGAEAVITYGCSFFLNETVCSGAVHSMGDVLVPQLTDFILTGKYSCSRIFGFCDSPTWVTLNPNQYVHRVISEKPDIIKNNDYVDNLYKMIKEDPKEREIIKILHMSDLHMDTLYSPGASTDCGQPLCCRAGVGPSPVPLDKAAGKYGDYGHCDLPPWTVESLFNFVKEMEDGPDLVFWTGDNVAHDIWNQTEHKNAEATDIIIDFIYENWPELPVFLSTGNHEFYPVNVEGFDPNDQPILNILAEHWGDYLGEEDLEQFKKYGYYSVKLRGIGKEFENVSVITLNTQACNDLNWKLVTTLNDPGNQLQWLENKLKDVEAENGLVYIIGHIPPRACLHDWSVRYKALSERFQHIIRFQGFGHWHEEGFATVRGAYDFNPFGSNHYAGSVTTMSGKNPSFRIMDMDKETMLPVKMHTYILNITRANLEDKVTWEHAYEFTEAYEMEDLSPTSLSKFTDRIFDKPELAVTYLKNMHGQGGSDSDYYTSCDTGCQWNLKCDLLSATNQANSECLGDPYPDILSDIRNFNFNEYLFDPWISGPSPSDL